MQIINMKTVVAKDSQTLVDVVLTHCGTIEALMEVAIYNRIPADSDINVGDIVVIPDGTPIVAKVVEYFADNKIDVSTKP